MTYCDVVCHECHGDLICLTCEETTRLTTCHNCQAEMKLPVVMKPETFDPEAVRQLAENIVHNSFGLPPRMVADAQAVLDSERE